MKYSADELANKLEERAKSLRENGLTQEDMDMASGGSGCECCGSSCQFTSEEPLDCNAKDPYDTTVGTCVRSCIFSSAD